MKHRLLPIILCLVAALGGGLLRFWNLTAAVDAAGVPISHPSNYMLAAAALAALLVFWLCSRPLSRSDAGHEAIACASGGCVLLMAAGALMLVGSALELLERLYAGIATPSPAIMCLLGAISSLCCLVFASARRQGKPGHPLFSLFPVLYLILKLIIHFKSWSVDPIILDYCVALFALIFTLLAFHRTAGFALGEGRPHTALFFSMAAVFFCAGAMVDGLMDRSAAALVTYLGFLLWQLPLIWALSRKSK